MCSHTKDVQFYVEPDMNFGDVKSLWNLQGLIHNLAYTGAGAYCALFLDSFLCQLIAEEFNTFLVFVRSESGLPDANLEFIFIDKNEACVSIILYVARGYVSIGMLLSNATCKTV
jgi:hypothetical protein